MPYCTRPLSPSVSQALNRGLTAVATLAVLTLPGTAVEVSSGDRHDIAAAPAPNTAVQQRTDPRTLLASVAVGAPGARRIPGLDADVLRAAVDAVQCAVASGAAAMPSTLTVIDYSKPSTERRLWVFDVPTGRLLYHELVAHGRGTGENMARRFSNELNSHQTSLGLFVTEDTYVGQNGYSLRLRGLEPGINDRARERAIVVHGAPYVDQRLAAQVGRLGRSWGCPALRPAVARPLIDTIKGGGMIFSYYPDSDWTRTSPFLSRCSNTVQAD